MRLWIEKTGAGRFRFEPASFATVGDGKLIGSMRRVGADGLSDARYCVLAVRDGKIADMQVCGTRRQARRFARRGGHA